MPRKKSIEKQIDNSFKQHRQMLVDSMKGLDTSSRAWLDRLVALSTLERNWRKERAERGLAAQNLGLVKKIEYKWIAKTAKYEPPSETARDREIRDELNREFGDLPAVAAKENKKGSGSGSGSAPAALQPAPGVKQ